VDNITPGAPQLFTGQYAGGTASLHWVPNSESDLAGYHLYRGGTANFVAGPSSLIATLPDTGYADAAGGPFFYRLSAYDQHGNDSPSVMLLPSGTTGVVSPGLPKEIVFLAPEPNPARDGVWLSIELPREARVSLAIFDATGRRVRLVREGIQPAGESRIRWNLQDEAGRPISRGLYWVRMVAENRQITRRLVAL